MNVADAAPSAAQDDAIARDVAGALAIVGPPGSGKSFALLRRAERLALREPARTVWLAAPSAGGVRRLAERASDAVVCARFDAIAFEIVRAERARSGAPAPVAIDEPRAFALFERAGADLFALAWPEIERADLDPEIPGLRSPERFAAAAFRLIRKLRASLVSPEAFRASGLRGATEFYGRPPNFASPDLIAQTHARYRDSLRVSPDDLEQQRAREVDLVRVLARLYEGYVATIAEADVLAPSDALYEAVRLLRADADACDRARARFAAALVDDAQDCAAGQLGLLEAIFGPTLVDVTFAGDELQSTRGFATGARGGEVFKRAAATVTLAARDGEPAIARAARAVGDPTNREPALPPGAARDRVRTYRAATMHEEARYVAGEVVRLLAAGCAPARIAVVTRNLACAHPFIDALLARDVPLDPSGAARLYDFPVVQDALAALWSVADPFRHDYLLRALEAPWLRLSDASIATLCGDAPDAQPLLFTPPEGDTADEARAGRWDRRRDIRLGRNVTRGDADLALSDDARERLAAFRAARERWERAARRLPLPAFARLVLDESVLATLEPSARGRFDAGLVTRLIGEVDAFAAREPLGDLDAFLASAERASDDGVEGPELAPLDREAVTICDVEAAKGRHFDAVFLVDVRAGAWPRYYVPDAFLFIPALGMIAKENVGDARAARTAKFTYTLAKFKLREKYNAEERRAFYCAATRARSHLTVTASGRATKGVSTPELLAELEVLTGT
jgi:superfamily I DNA/RNA helicase